MELLAGRSAESANAATLIGFAEKVSSTVDLAQEVFEEKIVCHYDNVNADSNIKECPYHGGRKPD